MSASKRDLNRVYWSLVVLGPMTLADLRTWTNWTTHRTNDALQRLKRYGCVRLTERGQHKARFNVCGKWQAITEQDVSESPVIDAISA